MITELKKLPLYLKPYLPLFIGCMIFSSVIYFILMSNQLVNPYDGLWEYSYYTAGYWELSLGRWAWLYLDQLRMGISFDPLTSLITLACFSAGMLLIVDLFELQNRKTSYIICGLFLSNTAVCISLSYRYMSPTFGVAFLLNILAVWVLAKVRKSLFSVPVSGFLIAIGMGMYQANIGCTCIVILGYWIYVLFTKDILLKDMLINILKFFIAAILGGLLYVGILNVHLWIFHTSLSSYNGASSYSFTNTLLNLPASIGKAYTTFWSYFTDTYYLSNIFQKYKIFVIAFIFVLLLLLYGIVTTWKKNKWNALLSLLFILAIPIACNAVIFIATATGTSMQMTVPLALCFPILLCIETQLFPTARKAFIYLYRINLVLMLLILYGNVYQVQLDQNAMLEGKIATTTLATEIIHDVHELGYVDSDMQFCIVGVPIGNPLFKTSALYNSSNIYARFGNWWTDPGCTRRSWQGVFSYLCGANLEICSTGNYNEQLASETVQNMPIYPTPGSIAVINDIVVIKVSP